MRSGVADTLSTDDSWTDVDGKYFFRSIQFMLRYYWVERDESQGFFVIIIKRRKVNARPIHC